MLIALVQEHIFEQKIRKIKTILLKAQSCLNGVWLFG